MLFPASVPDKKQKKYEKFMRICTFYGRNVKVCVMSVMCFYFPLRNTRKNDLLGFKGSCWALALLMDTNPRDEWWYLLYFILISPHKHFSRLFQLTFMIHEAYIFPFFLVFLPTWKFYERQMIFLGISIGGELQVGG